MDMVVYGIIGPDGYGCLWVRIGMGKDLRRLMVGKMGTDDYGYGWVHKTIGTDVYGYGWVEMGRDEYG